MNGEAIVAVSAAVVALVSLVKWAGVPEKYAPISVLVLSALGVALWVYSDGSLARKEIFEVFSGWVAVSLSAAGVYGFTRAGGETLTRFKNPNP